MKILLARVNWILSAQFGIDLRKCFKSLVGIPRFMRDFIRFKSHYTGKMGLVPCLHDWHEEGGATKSEYFWQDLLIARKIFAGNPVRHVDIGSRVDGFVAQVASFRSIEVFDVRPITTQIPGVEFKQADFMMPMLELNGYCDSLSCLHALEHFGLGRYGDPISQRGFELGLANMAKLLSNNGVFYLSVPIGIERVEFNANRVFDPRTILSVAWSNSLIVDELIVIKSGGMVENVLLEDEVLEKYAAQRYNLGIFIFSKYVDPLEVH